MARAIRKGAGGAFGLLVSDRDDVPELVDVHRFINEWEKTASLDLRHGRTDVIDTYLDHGRVTGGDSDSIAAVAGAILGAAQNENPWPAQWAHRLEPRYRAWIADAANYRLGDPE